MLKKSNYGAEMLAEESKTKECGVDTTFKVSTRSRVVYILHFFPYM